MPVNWRGQPAGFRTPPRKNASKNILGLPQRRKYFNGVARRALESGFDGLDQGRLAAAQKGVGRLFQGQGRRQRGQAAPACGLIARFPLQQGGVGAIHGLGEAYIADGVFVRAKNQRIIW